MSKLASRTLLYGLLLLPTPLLAGSTLLVDDDTTQCPAAAFTSIAAALTAAAPTGDTIEVCDGTYAEGTLLVDKEVTIDGQNRDQTLINVTASTTFGFHVRASNVTIRDLVIQEIGGGAVSGANGIRFEPSGPSIDNAVVNNVVIRDFLDGSARGIEVHTGTFNDISILNSTFSNNLYGVRMSSSTLVDGVILTNNAFSAPTNGGDFTRIGFYQANDGAASTFSGLQATGNSFTNLSLAGIFVEELRFSSIATNTFTGNYTGIIIDKRYAGTALPVNAVSIASNSFVNNTGRAVFISSLTMGLGANVSITNNDIDVAAGALNGNRGAITTNFHSSFTHALLTISGNNVTFSGAFGVGIGGFAVNLAGDGPVLIDRNTFDGGGIGTSGTTPPPAAIYLQTNHTGTVPLGLRQDPVTVTCNTLTGFVHGITVRDPVTPANGNLSAGTSVEVHTNDIDGNSAFGIFNGTTPDTSEVIDADSNYWGDPSGPSGQGPGTGDAISQFVSGAAWLIGAQTLCTTPVELLGFAVD